MSTIRNSEKIDKNCEHKNVLIKIGIWRGVEKKTGKLVSGPVLFCEACFKKINIPWDKWKELERSYLTEKK